MRVKMFQINSTVSYMLVQFDTKIRTPHYWPVQGRNHQWIIKKARIFMAMIIFMWLMVESIVISTIIGKASWWRHQMETFSALLALCAGNSPVPVNSLHKGQWRGALMFTLLCARINDWVNNRVAVDLRRHLDHYDVSVMWVKRKHNNKTHIQVIVW